MTTITSTVTVTLQRIDCLLLQGDSGDPLVYFESDGVYTQVGIASFVASGGCQQGLPAGFTRVTSYLDWISSNTGIAVGY